MKKWLFVVLVLMSSVVIAQEGDFDIEGFRMEFTTAVSAYNVHINLFLGRGGREVNGYDAYQYLLTVVRLLEIGKANGFFTEEQYNEYVANITTMSFGMATRAWNMGYESLESMIAWVERNRLR